MSIINYKIEVAEDDKTLFTTSPYQAPSLEKGRDLKNAMALTKRMKEAFPECAIYLTIEKHENSIETKVVLEL